MKQTRVLIGMYIYNKRNVPVIMIIIPHSPKPGPERGIMVRNVFLLLPVNFSFISLPSVRRHWRMIITNSTQHKLMQ